MFMLLLIYMYLTAPWKVGYNQMGYARKIKKLLTYYFLTFRKILFSIYFLAFYIDSKYPFFLLIGNRFPAYSNLSNWDQGVKNTYRR